MLEQGGKRELRLKLHLPWYPVRSGSAIQLQGRSVFEGVREYVQRREMLQDLPGEWTQTLQRHESCPYVSCSRSHTCGDQAPLELPTASGLQVGGFTVEKAQGVNPHICARMASFVRESREHIFSSVSDRSTSSGNV